MCVLSFSPLPASPLLSVPLCCAVYPSPSQPHHHRWCLTHLPSSPAFTFSFSPSSNLNPNPTHFCLNYNPSSYPLLPLLVTSLIIVLPRAFYLLRLTPSTSFRQSFLSLSFQLHSPCQLCIFSLLLFCLSACPSVCHLFL